MFCYALSFGLHAALASWLAATPIPQAPPFASRPTDMPDGERHIVTVTMVMKMSDFANQPAYSEPSDRNAPPSDTPPTKSSGTPKDKAPAQPELVDNTPRDPAPSEPRENERTAAPEQPREALIADQRQENRPPPPSDLPGEPVPEPLPEQAAQGTPPKDQAPADSTPPTATPTPPSPEAIAREALDVIEDVLPLLRELARNLPNPAQPASQPEQDNSTPAHNDELAKAEDNPVPDRAEPTPPAEPIEQAADATSPQDAAPSAPTSTESGVPEPPAVVYDEDSVDKRIGFKKMVRPAPSSISRSLQDTGTISILIEVNKDGKLLSHRVIDDDNQPRLRIAALKALKASTFTPGERNGRPVRSTRVIEYRFD